MHKGHRTLINFFIARVTYPGFTYKFDIFTLQSGVKVSATSTGFKSWFESALQNRYGFSICMEVRELRSNYYCKNYMPLFNNFAL